MPSGRSPPPFGFGIITRRTGPGRYVLETNSSRKPTSHASRPDASIAAKVTPWRRQARESTQDIGYTSNDEGECNSQSENLSGVEAVVSVDRFPSFEGAEGSDILTVALRLLGSGADDTPPSAPRNSKLFQLWVIRVGRCIVLFHPAIKPSYARIRLGRRSVRLPRCKQTTVPTRLLDYSRVNQGMDAIDNYAVAPSKNGS